MNRDFRILHHIIYNGCDYDTGSLIIIIMEGDNVIEVAATPFIRNITVCDVLNRYKLHGISSN